MSRKRGRRRWLHIGVFPFEGHQPGDVFEAHISPERAARLVASGVLQRARPNAPSGPADGEPETKVEREHDG